MTPELLIGSITLFVLSIFLGFELITKVPATLHTPLMSGANAISGISIVGALIGGSVIVESVFAWPGLGMLAFESLFARDLNLLLGIFLLSSALVVAVNLVVDVVYCFLDPRIEVN